MRVNQIPDHVWRSRKPRARVYLLTKRGFAILTLSSMYEGGRLGVKTVQTLRLLVHICVVLRHELPPDFRRNNIVLSRLRSHDEDCVVSKNRRKLDRKNKTAGNDLQWSGRACRRTGKGMDDREAWSEW
jgi:hypothetical protein